MRISSGVACLIIVLSLRSPSAQIQHNTPDRGEALEEETCLLQVTHGELHVRTSEGRELGEQSRVGGQRVGGASSVQIPEETSNQTSEDTLEATLDVVEEGSNKTLKDTPQQESRRTAGDGSNKLAEEARELRIIENEPHSEMIEDNLVVNSNHSSGRRRGHPREPRVFDVKVPVPPSWDLKSNVLTFLAGCLSCCLGCTCLVGTYFGCRSCSRSSDDDSEPKRVICGRCESINRPDVSSESSLQDARKRFDQLRKDVDEIKKEYHKNRTKAIWDLSSAEAQLNSLWSNEVALQLDVPSFFWTGGVTAISKDPPEVRRKELIHNSEKIKELIFNFLHDKDVSLNSTAGFTDRQLTTARKTLMLDILTLQDDMHWILIKIKDPEPPPVHAPGRET